MAHELQCSHAYTTLLCVFLAFGAQRKILDLLCECLLHKRLLARTERTPFEQPEGGMGIRNHPFVRDLL